MSPGSPERNEDPAAPPVVSDPDETRVNAPAPLRVGSYTILRKIKAGGMGVVYEAYDPKLNRRVALKRPNTACERFCIEARAAAALHHPAIVPVYEVGEDDGPFLVMHLANGGSLQQQLDSDGPLPPALAAVLLHRLAEAVQFAHDHGVVHRDLKPGNVLLHDEKSACEAGAAQASVLRAARGCGTVPPGLCVQLTDFGLARLTREESPSVMGEVMGTPSYMPPEQAVGNKKAIGPLADVYSLGAVLYALLTGRPPFQAATMLEVLRLVQTEEPVPPRRLNSGIPRDLQTICLKCLEKDPARRYPSAAALADDLRRFRNGEAIQARPAGTTEHVLKWMQRRPAIAALLALVLVLTLAGACAFTWAYRRAIHERDRAIHERDRALAARVQQLASADVSAVPTILEDPELLLDETRPSLRAVWENDPDRKHRMRVGLVLLASEPDAVREELLAWMLETDDPRELVLACARLDPFRDSLAGRLWDRVEKTDKPEVRFSALVALARFDPENPRWPIDAPGTVKPLLRAEPHLEKVLTDAFRPVRGHLIGPLAEVARGKNEELRDKRLEAVRVLADYADDRIETLVDLLADADERQFALLFPKIQAKGNPALDLLRREFMRATLPDRIQPPPGTAPGQSAAERSDLLASRRANLAVALLRLDQGDLIWPLLGKYAGDPTLRTYLTLRMASHGVEARALVARLERTAVVSEQRALLSALGEYSEAQLPPDLRGRLKETLLLWYRDHPDPGLHASIDWLLRQKMDGPRQRAFAWEGGTDLEAIDSALRGPPKESRNWSVTGQGQTMIHLQLKPEGRPFAISSKKVTVRDFCAFLRANPTVCCPRLDAYKPVDDWDPMTRVDCYTAAQYCRWLSEQEKNLDEKDMYYPEIAELERLKVDETNPALPLLCKDLSRKGYRLPTTAEWEYACRADSSATHFFGGGDEDLLAVFAWIPRNSQEKPWPVGQKRPNDFGMFDAHGNTWDWCMPEPGQSGYKDEMGGPKVEYRDLHFCGGSFLNRASQARSGSTNSPRTRGQFKAVGLRVARTL